MKKWTAILVVADRCSSALDGLIGRCEPGDVGVLLSASRSTAQQCSFSTRDRRLGFSYEYGHLSVMKTSKIFWTYWVVSHLRLSPWQMVLQC